MQLQPKAQKYALPVILILIAMAIAFYLFFPKSTNNIDTSNMATQSAAKLAQAGSIAEQNKATMERTSAQGPYVLVAETDGQKALDLLDEYVQVGYREYTMGSMVESINGLAGDKQNFWAFYVNGEFATKAVDRTILKAGDSIEFIYEQAEVYKGI